jgi:hypothetical protein
MEEDGTMSITEQERRDCYDKIMKDYWENPSARNSMPPTPPFDKNNPPGPNNLHITNRSFAAKLDAALEEDVATVPPLNTTTLNSYPADIFDG